MYNIPRILLAASRIVVTGFSTAFCVHRGWITFSPHPIRHQGVFGPNLGLVLLVESTSLSKDATRVYHFPASVRYVHNDCVALSALPTQTIPSLWDLCTVRQSSKTPPTSTPPLFTSPGSLPPPPPSPPLTPPAPFSTSPLITTLSRSLCLPVTLETVTVTSPTCLPW